MERRVKWFRRLIWHILDSPLVSVFMLCVCMAIAVMVGIVVYLFAPAWH